MPSEVSIATAALFISETVSLARIRMVKEGYKVPEKKSNKFLQDLGIYGDSEFEEVVKEEQQKQEEQQEIVIDRGEENYK